MPNSIADLIYSQMQTAGKPRTVTTTATQPNEPLDLGSLGLLLYMLLQGQKKSAATAAAGPNVASLIPSAMGGVGAGASGMGSATAGGMDPMSLMMAILGGMKA